MRDLRDFTLECRNCQFRQQANRDTCLVCGRPFGNSHAKQYLKLRKCPTKLLDRIH